MNGAAAKLARLRGARRIWAVGSIHGEAERLQRLHDRIAERLAEGDRIVYLGNFLGRGTAVTETVDELLDFRRRVLARPRGFACDIVHLRGAQEEMWHKLLQLQFAANPGEVLSWMVREGVDATIAAYGGELRHGFAATRDGPRTITRWTSALRSAMNASPGHVQLYAGLRHAALTEEAGGVLFVSAGVDASRPLAHQGDAFWWSRGDILDLAAPFAGFRRVVCGFDRRCRGPAESAFAFSLDAGAGRGGPLLAAAVATDGTITEVLRA